MVTSGMSRRSRSSRATAQLDRTPVGLKAVVRTFLLDLIESVDMSINDPHSFMFKATVRAPCARAGHDYAARICMFMTGRRACKHEEKNPANCLLK